MTNIDRVAIVAGTHGNELSGLYLNKLIRDGRYDAKRSTFESTTITANTKAVEQRVRFIDEDLNRQFAMTEDSSNSSHEAAIARDFIAAHASNDSQLLIDLHNTTSHMGATLILVSDSEFYTKMGAYVKQRMPQANILFETHLDWEQQPFLCTTSKHGVMIEVGAQAHNSLLPEPLELMKQMLSLILDYVEKRNLKQLTDLQAYDAFYHLQEVPFPIDSDGMRAAMVHPTLCGQDFKVLKPGEPLLATFAGYDVYWEQNIEVYPHFINESAYAASHIAMSLAQKKRVNV